MEQNVVEATLARRVLYKRKMVTIVYYACLGLAGLVFGLACLIIAFCGLLLDLLSFGGLLAVAFGSLIWGRARRIKFENPVRKYFRPA